MVGSGGADGVMGGADGRRGVPEAVLLDTWVGFRELVGLVAGKAVSVGGEESLDKACSIS